MEQLVEGSNCQMYVQGARHFAAGVHTEHGGANVDGFDAELGCRDGTDAGATAQVAPGDEVLRFVFGFAAQTLEERRGLCGGGVRLVGVGLNDHAAVYVRCVFAIVKVGIIRMDRMGHVG